MDQLGPNRQRLFPFQESDGCQGLALQGNICTSTGFDWSDWCHTTFFTASHDFSTESTGGGLQAVKWKVVQGTIRKRWAKGLSEAIVITQPTVAIASIFFLFLNQSLFPSVTWVRISRQRHRQPMIDFPRYNSLAKFHEIKIPVTGWKDRVERLIRESRNINLWPLV
jgi:hypothetical protein